MKVYLVYSDDCFEGDCMCFHRSLDSVWFDKEKAEARMKEVFRGEMDEEEVRV